MRFVPHNRQSIRLQTHDYAADGMYFVTICVEGRECLLGDVVNEKLVLNSRGRFAETALLWLPKQYEYVKIDSYVIMPNHMHAILVIGGGSRTAATPRKSLGRLVGVFKTVSTKWINVMHNTPSRPFWQRNYYDRIIRDQRALNGIRQYIADNPRRWAVRERPN